MGDRLANLSKAAQELSRLPATQLIQMATILETQAVGGPPQDDFLNTVVEVSTELTPRQLLSELQALERRLGRLPGPRWGPRVIDLDLLFYEACVIQEPDLVVPHPRAHERRFVLEPLAQLAPQMIHPILKQTVTHLLEQVAFNPVGSQPESCR